MSIRTKLNKLILKKLDETIEDDILRAFLREIILFERANKFFGKTQYKNYIDKEISRCIEVQDRAQNKESRDH